MNVREAVGLIEGARFRLLQWYVMHRGIAGLENLEKPGMTELLEELRILGYECKLIERKLDIAELVIDGTSVFLEYWDDTDWQVDMNIHRRCQNFLKSV